MKLKIFHLGIGPILTLASVGATAWTDTATFQTQSYAVPHGKGYVPSARNERFLSSARRRSFTATNTTVPGQYSLRGKAGPVEDQGQCGSCWDFSLTSVLRGTWIVSGNDPGRLSFNYLLNCDTSAMGCDGGDFTAAELFVNPQGAPAYGSDGDYNGVAGSCMSEPAIASTVSYNLLGSDLGVFPGKPTPSFQDIAYVVGVLHQPVVVDVVADGKWEDYASGVFNACDHEDASQIDHMVSVEGYSCETSVDASGNCVFDENGDLPPGVGTWLIRNSWGTTWGDSGYITTKATDKKGVRCNAVATDALYYDLKGTSASF